MWRHNGKEKQLLATVTIDQSNINSLIKSFASNIKKLRIKKCFDVNLLLISQSVKLKYFNISYCVIK